MILFSFIRRTILQFHLRLQKQMRKVTCDKMQCSVINGQCGGGKKGCKQSL